MKKLLGLSFIFLFFGISFTQSKKKQIQILSTRLDSLKTIQITEKQIFEIIENELQTSINKQNHKIFELLESHLTKKENLISQIEENKNLGMEIISLEQQLKSIEDSIQKIIELQPIKFIDRNLLNKSDEELIKMMDISYSDLGEEVEGWKITLFDDYFYPDPEMSCIQVFELNGKNFCVLVLHAYNPVLYEHWASGSTFLGLLEENNEFWSLSKKASTFGSIKGMPGSLEKFSLMGDKTLAIQLLFFDDWDGIFNTDRKIYALINNEFVLVYEGNMHWDEGGATGSLKNSSDTDVSFIKNKSKFYDLKVTDKKEGKKVKTTILKFHENSLKYE